MSAERQQWNEAQVPDDGLDEVEVGLPVVPADWTPEADGPTIENALVAEDHLRAIAYWERKKAEAMAHAEAVIARQAQPIIDRAGRRVEELHRAYDREIGFHAIGLRGFAGNELRNRKKGTGYGTVKLINGEIKKTQGSWKTEVAEVGKFIAKHGDEGVVETLTALIEETKATAPFVRLKLVQEPNISEIGEFCKAQGAATGTDTAKLVPEGATYSKGPDTWKITAAQI